MSGRGGTGGGTTAWTAPEQEEGMEHVGLGGGGGGGRVKEDDEEEEEDDSHLPQKPICALMLIRIRDWGRRR